MERKEQRGFAFVELLIVVAIIAVLVAIAVPLFVGALDKAKEETFDANARSIKSIGVYEILTKPDEYKKGAAAKEWNITGKVDEHGNIEITSIEKGNEKKATTYDKWDGETITVFVQEIDLPDTP